MPIGGTRPLRTPADIHSPSRQTWGVKCLAQGHNRRGWNAVGLRTATQNDRINNQGLASLQRAAVLLKGLSCPKLPPRTILAVIQHLERALITEEQRTELLRSFTATKSRTQGTEEESRRHLRLTNSQESRLLTWC